MRLATEEDFPMLEELSWNFWKLSGETYEYNAEKVLMVIEKCVYEGVALVTERGFILGVVSPGLFHEASYLVEIGWYAEDGRGQELLRGFIKEGERLGVDEIRMSTLPMSRAAKVILKRHGFREQEVSYSLKV